VSRPERADAVRNRRRVLDAARHLFADRGIEHVTMQQVAEAAGVAKGTVFHRFGDRAGLVRALVGDAEAELQEAVLRGAPPLGPGASPLARTHAFLDALLALTARHADLLSVADAGPGARLRTGAYAAWHQYLTYLLNEAGVATSAPTTAHVLLAGLAPDLVRAVGAAGRDELAATLRGLADRLVRQ
jgi:AcrR family transcriptional regulator